ncbi:hypothetical protein PFISCL1PPCAC_11539, partial [Pristionchus fissidentatus]
AAAAADAATPDNRVQWATVFVEGQNAKSLQQEFITQLRDYTAPERTAVAFEANVKRNRYRDIPCFDQERVILCKWPHDYINANYFNAPDGVKYIATQ